MRRFTSIGAIALAMGLVAPEASAQDSTTSISLEDAHVLFGRNSPELRLARSRMAAALGRARQGRAIPNPVASFTTEELGSYSERYFNLSQPVDFAWTGGSRSRRSEAWSGQARATFDADSARLTLELKRAFVQAWRQARFVSALSQTDAVLAGLLDDAQARFDQGDLAGYDLRRLGVARATVRRRLAVERVTLADSERRLGSLVMGDGSLPRLRPESPDLRATAITIDVGAVETALGRRPELRATEYATEALDAEAVLAGRSRFANAALTGGFKQQSDGQDGAFVGLRLPIPLFDRKGGAVDAARAAAAGSRADLDILRIAVAREAALAEARLASARTQLDLIEEGADEPGELLEIATLAYDEGEVGIVELVDAADAFLEARLFDSDVRADLWLAVFELEYAIGGLPNDSGTGEER